MTKIRKKYARITIFYTVIAILLLCGVFVSVIAYTYNAKEEKCFENLHVHTKEIKDDLNLQVSSDMENLQTLANIAATLYINNGDYSVLFDSFKPIGLIEAIGILFPDNTLKTSTGETVLTGKIDFNEEASRGSYVSGLEEDLTVEGEKIIRSAVPIIVNGETVAIVYGRTKLESLREKYIEKLGQSDNRLILVDRRDGSFIIDSRHENPGLLPSLGGRESKSGYSYDDMYRGIMSGDNGFSAFKSEVLNEFMYVHWAPLSGEIVDWTIMLGIPESKVFEELYSIQDAMLFMFLLALIIMITYLAGVFLTERRRTSLTTTSAEVRKLLLEINRQKTSINEALKLIADFAKSNSAFIADTDGLDFNYINPRFEKLALLTDDRKYFISKIVERNYTIHLSGKVNINFVRENINKSFQAKNPEFYEFCVKHKIRNFLFASIVDKSYNINIIGAINVRRCGRLRMLLSEIGVCFSMAIYNRRHLNKTEVLASTDFLTGLSNRVAYKKDIQKLEKIKNESISCIFIDVNELHSFNNRFGHAAGDTMLLHVANALKEAFPDAYIYRMGGDEFLIFSVGMKEHKVEKAIVAAINAVEERNYHIAVGVVHCISGADLEALVKEAERRMYDAKARYYQQKEAISLASNAARHFEHMATGISEIDKMLEVISEHYFGIYYVSLESDRARRLVMPSELEYAEVEDNFSGILKKYVSDTVHPDFHRTVNAFIQYEAIRNQLRDGLVPRITYKKTNGEAIALSIHSMEKTKDGLDTVWVFEEA